VVYLLLSKAFYYVEPLVVESVEPKVLISLHIVRGEHELIKVIRVPYYLSIVFSLVSNVSYDIL
jgi:hypothetical protein